MNPITMPVAELKPALAGLGKIIGRRHTLPVLGSVKIERTGTGHIEITATDLDAAVIVQLATPDQGAPVSMLVPLEDLANVAKNSGREDALVLTLVAKDKAAIRFPVAGQILEHGCESLPVEEFPAVQEVNGPVVPLDATLRHSIHEALACASIDPTRLILNSACLDVSKRGAHYVVGTDGHHLFSSNSFNLPLAESVILPSHAFFGWKGFNEDGDWRLRVNTPAKKEDAPAFEIASDHWRFIGRAREGNYPNWRQAVPGENAFGTAIAIAPEGIENVITTILRLPDHDCRHHTLGIEVRDRRVLLLAKSTADQPWTEIETPEAKGRGSDDKVFLNRLLILKALRFGLARIELMDVRSPARFSDGGRQMIIMPVRADAAPAPTPSTPPPAPTPAAANTNPPPQPAEQPKEATTMPENNGTNTTGAKRADTNAEEPKAALDAALAQVEVVRGDFRNAIAGLNKLGELLKHVQRENKSTEKEISSVRQTLRSLQSVRI